MSKGTPVSSDCSSIRGSPDGSPVRDEHEHARDGSLAVPARVHPLTAAGAEILRLDRVEIAAEPWSWPFASERRDEIARHFAGIQSRRAGVWNGRVLLLHRFAIVERVLRGACFVTDYASFCAWKDWNFPDPGVLNFFGAATLRSADGAYLLGEMAPSTAKAGKLYFPCGTPEPADLDATGAVDLAAGVRRELLEETGIEAPSFDRPGWIAIRDRSYLALLKLLTMAERADELRSRIMRHIASEADPELVDIRIVRGPADLDERMSPFVVTFLKDAWRQ
jgi:8-oxo-dGTP pyrophosphatase MutT (NUDIX family)